MVATLIRSVDDETFGTENRFACRQSPPRVDFRARTLLSGNSLNSVSLEDKSATRVSCLTQFTLWR